MSEGVYKVPTPLNEPVRGFAPDSAERASLKRALEQVANTVAEIPNVIAGKHVFTGNTVDVCMPSNHKHVLAKLHVAGEKEVAAAVDAAEAARAEWAALSWDHRAAVFLKAAKLLETTWRDRVLAATMLGQGKTCHQAEIDAACELIDFWRFNALYAAEILQDQPPISNDNTWNRTDYRPLDGFIFAVSPFNFSSIALNLPTAPAYMGNTAVWKPAQTSALSCWVLMQILEEAGLPPGVINMVHGPGRPIGDQVLARPELAGLHFTGSTATFQSMWRTVGENLPNYNNYPRLVGETGGKDFILAHPTSDPVALSVAILRGCFEYQGQKCSASSRLYVPSNLWPEVRERVVAGMAEMKMGDPRDFSNFVSAVIDERAFKKHKSYLDYGRANAELVAGGESDDTVGWYIQPTLFRVDHPRNKLMTEEIFGPIATVYVFEPEQFDEMVKEVDEATPYALTGAIWGRDRLAIAKATEGLRSAAGNFYINDKPTGAVVGQQPFGGGRASGTNDKAGSALNLLRWTSPRSIKETFVPDREWRYPFME